MIRVCVAGATGWTGSAVTQGVLASKDLKLCAAIARKGAGTEIGGVKITASLAETAPFDVLIDYTHPSSVKQRTLEALAKKIRVVIGTSGLSAQDFGEIEKAALAHGSAVIASGNFSITAALAKHFSLIAARHLPAWEVIDYAYDGKPDAPSGTARELAESMARVKPSQLKRPISEVLGYKEARGASIAGSQVHSVRLPGYTAGFQALFGLPHERLTIHHDSGTSAEPYVAGTLLAARKVMGMSGLVRGLDTLLFS